MTRSGRGDVLQDPLTILTGIVVVAILVVVLILAVVGIIPVSVIWCACAWLRVGFRRLGRCLSRCTAFVRQRFPLCEEASLLFCAVGAGAGILALAFTKLHS